MIDGWHAGDDGNDDDDDDEYFSPYSEILIKRPRAPQLNVDGGREIGSKTKSSKEKPFAHFHSLTHLFIRLVSQSGPEVWAIDCSPSGGRALFGGVGSRINIKLGLLSKQCLAKIIKEPTNNDQMARDGRKCTQSDWEWLGSAVIHRYEKLKELSNYKNIYITPQKLLITKTSRRCPTDLCTSLCGTNINLVWVGKINKLARKLIRRKRPLKKGTMGSIKTEKDGKTNKRGSCRM